MADSDKPKSNKPAVPGGDMPVERRMLLALALVGLVLLLSQWLYSPSAPSKTGATQTKPATREQASKPAAPPAEAAPAATPAPAATAGGIKGEREQFTTVETEVYKVVFSNRGAVVRSWILKNYRDSKGQPLELVNKKGAEKTHFPFQLVFESQKPVGDLNQTLWAANQDGLQVRFEYSDGRTIGRKTFLFQQNSYLVNLTSEVQDGGNGIPHMLAWRGGFGDRAVHAAASTMKTLHFDVSQNKLVEHDAKAAENGPALVSGTYEFAGIQDSYFAAVFLPHTAQTVKLQTWNDKAQLTPESGEEALVGVAVGGDPVNRYSIFVGPKDLDLLKRVDPKLTQVVDFGWFAFIAKPLFLFLNWLNDNYIHNFGWAIIIATIIINMLLLPLKLSGMKSMKKMSALQPEIQKINERYKNLGLTDPRKAQQNEEIMALYKKHGVNPLGGGCMPLLLQIPFFYAFYKVLSIAIEVRGAEWLWIKDLAQYDPLYILPIVMVVTQFVLQKMTPSTTTDPAQQRMMMLMPLMFGFLFFKASAGLVLYWFTGNVVSIVQQWLINRATPAPAAATATVNAPKPAKRNGRK